MLPVDVERMLTGIMGGNEESDVKQCSSSNRARTITQCRVHFWEVGAGRMKFWKKGFRSSRVAKMPPFSEGYRQAPKDLLPFTPVSLSSLSDVSSQSAISPTDRLLSVFTSDIHAFPPPFVMHACPRECTGILDRWLGVGVLSVMSVHESKTTCSGSPASPVWCVLPTPFLSDHLRPM